MSLGKNDNFGDKKYFNLKHVRTGGGGLLFNKTAEKCPFVEADAAVYTHNTICTKYLHQLPSDKL